MKRLYDPPLEDGRPSLSSCAPGIRHYRHGNIVVVEAPPEVDVYTVGVLENRLRELASWPHLAVDLRGTALVDPAGLHVLLTAHQEAAREGSRFTVICDRPAVLRTLRENHLNRVLDIRESLQ